MYKDKAQHDFVGARLTLNGLLRWPTKDLATTPVHTVLPHVMVCSLEHLEHQHSQLKLQRPKLSLASRKRRKHDKTLKGITEQAEHYIICVNTCK